MSLFVLNNYQKHRRGRISLWSNELILSDRLARICNSLHAPADGEIDLLKESLRRCVLRVRDFSDEHSSLIIKGFPLVKFESRLKYRKYGFAEANHYMQAQELGIPSPKCYGYFEQHGALMTVKANGVIIEDLSDHKTLGDLVAESPSEKLSILNEAIPIIKQLYQTGVNHIDLSPHNLMQSNDTKRIVLIDWQYCSFVTSNDVRQLVFQAAQFLRYTDLIEGDSDWSAWLYQLHDACAPQIDRESFLRNVSYVQAKKRASISDRLSLTLDLCD